MKKSLPKHSLPGGEGLSSLVLVIGFAVLIWMAIRAHKDAPPIPEKVVGPSGETIFTREDILDRPRGLPEIRPDGEWNDLGTWSLSRT